MLLERSTATMFQARIHGRGGQGVVTAAEMLSIAAFEEGKYAQAILSFGSERMGAPVVAYVRIDDAPIELAEPVMKPDLLIVQDPTLLHAVDVFADLDANGFVLINTARVGRPAHRRRDRRATGRPREHDCRYRTGAATPWPTHHQHGNARRHVCIDRTSAHRVGDHGDQ